MKSKVLLGIALALSLLAIPSSSYADNNNNNNNKRGGHAAQRSHGGDGGHAQNRSRGQAQQRSQQRVRSDRGRTHVERRNVRSHEAQRQPRWNARGQERRVQRHERSTRRHERNVRRQERTVRERERRVHRHNDAERRRDIRKHETRERREARGKRLHFSDRQRWRARDYYRHHRNHFHRVARVAWPIVIGGYVPRDYAVYDIPDDFYGYVPGYEGYKYIIVGDQLIIIDPDTWEIVAIIDLD